MSGPVLVGDVGGSNARFALSDGPGQLREVRSFKAAEHASFRDAVVGYLASISDTGAAEDCRAALIAAAGPVEEQQVQLTNSPWHIDPKELQEAGGFGTVRLFNDLEAVALALPHLSAREAQRIGPKIAEPLSGNPIAINVGTGFGAASAVQLPGGGWTALATEAGHISYAASSQAESELLGAAQSIEDLLSGAGVVRLHEMLQKRNAAAAAGGQPSDAATVFENCQEDASYAQTLNIFSDLLARVAGDLVLAHGAWGGVFFCGSVVKGWSGRSDAKRFREVFESKGKMSSRMRRVPTNIILAPEPALSGLTYVGL